MLIFNLLISIVLICGHYATQPAGIIPSCYHVQSMYVCDERTNPAGSLWILPYIYIVHYPQDNTKLLSYAIRTKNEASIVKGKIGV